LSHPGRTEGYEEPGSVCATILQSRYKVDQFRWGKTVIETYNEAALRHLTDAETLAANRRWGGASHLVGFAAECAIKYKIESLRPAQNAPHGHFPEIIEIAKKHIGRRRDAALHTILQKPALMADWTISLRYAEDAAVGEDHYDRWRKDAGRLLGAAGLKRQS
jgi:hypothetical protein